MKKVHVIALGFLLFVSIDAKAQTDTTIRKNEFGLGISNIISGLLGSVELEPIPLALTYKRLIHPNWALMTSYSYGSKFNTSDVFPSKVNDSLYIASYESVQKKVQTIRIGAEYRYSFRPRLFLVAGLQLQAAFANNKHDYYTWTGDSVRADQNSFLYSENEINKTNRKTLDAKQMGLCMHAGLITHLSKRFMLSAIWRPSMMISVNKEVKINEQTGAFTEYDYIQSEFTSSPLITEVSLFYRF